MVEYDADTIGTRYERMNENADVSHPYKRTIFFSRTLITHTLSHRHIHPLTKSLFWTLRVLVLEDPSFFFCAFFNGKQVLTLKCHYQTFICDMTIPE